MAHSGSGLQGFLMQLQESLSAADRCSAAMAGYHLIRGLGQECMLSTGPAVLGAYGPRRPRALRGSTRVPEKARRSSRPGDRKQ